MKIIFEYNPDNNSCGHYDHWMSKKSFLKNFDVQVSEVKDYNVIDSRIRCHFDGSMQTFPGLRIDLLSGFLSKHFKVS